jgi:hypothetical protein
MSEPTDGWSAPSGPPPSAPTPPQAAEWQAPPGWGAQPTGWGAQPTAPGQPAWGAPRPPEPRPGVIPLRPLGLGELLDGTVQVVRRYPRPTLGLSALIAVVTSVVNALFLLTAFAPFADLDTSSSGSSGTTAEFDAEVGGLLAGGLATAVVAGLATVVLAGVITAVVGRAVLGQPMTFGEAWAAVKPLVLRLVGLALLTGLIVFATLGVGVAVAIGLGAVGGVAGIVVAVPLGIGAVALTAYVYVRLSLAPAAMVLERCGIVESMRRSGVLVRRSWWRVFGILALTFIIVQVVGSVLQLPFGVLSSGSAFLTGEVDPSSLGYVLPAAIGGGIAQALVAPFESGVRALLYVDRRMRAEGLDVALQASSTTT